MRNPLLRRAARTARAIAAVTRRPPFMPPGHFYSPLSAPADVQRALEWLGSPPGAAPPGVDVRAAAQLELFTKLRPMIAEPFEGPRYTPDNSMYGPADGAVYRAMLRHLRPKRVMEIGSGFSTALALDTAAAHLDGLELTCVEPYPDRLLSVLTEGDADRITLVRRPVQEVPLDAYSTLEAGDVLFIDSTHVVKAGSDVVWLFLQVLPRLARGVVVHVHDVFWPFEYPRAWLAEGRDWTENYLLHAFLVGNASWEMLLFPSWVWKEHPAEVPADLKAEEPGSIWLRAR
jgi:predicted O-methyltransferase YrrM